MTNEASTHKTKPALPEPEVITASRVAGLFGGRRRDAHKGDCGRVLILAGSREMTGAAILCARGAYRSGAGVVYVCARKELFPTICAGVPEAVCLERGAEERVNIERFDAVAAGPGLGGGDETATWIDWLLENCAAPLVLDADALNALTHDDARGARTRSEALAARPPGRTILTPHVGEAARILGVKPEKVSADRRQAVARLVEMTGATVVLKGAGTLVAAPVPGAGLRAAINETGNPGMATGGSGDVLTGIVASFAAQGLDAFDAASAGVRLHGEAGDLAARKYGDGLMASDIAEATAFALAAVTGGTSGA